MKWAAAVAAVVKPSHTQTPSTSQSLKRLRISTKPKENAAPPTPIPIIETATDIHRRSSEEKRLRLKQLKTERALVQQQKLKKGKGSLKKPPPPPSAETAAVVKADAYGLGAARISARLLDEGVQSFFVAARNCIKLVNSNPPLFH